MSWEYDLIGKKLYTFVFSNGTVFSIEAMTVTEAMEIFKKDWYKNSFSHYNFEVFHNTGYHIGDDEEKFLFTFVFSDNGVYSCTASNVEEAMSEIDRHFNEEPISFYARYHFKKYRNNGYAAYKGWER